MDESQKSNEEANSISIPVSLTETELNRVVVVGEIAQDSCLSPKEKLCADQNNEECDRNAEFNDGSCEALQDDFQDGDEQRNNSSVVGETDEVQLSFLQKGMTENASYVILMPQTRSMTIFLDQILSLKMNFKLL